MMILKQNFTRGKILSVLVFKIKFNLDSLVVC